MAKKVFSGKNLIGGEWVAKQGGSIFFSRNPSHLKEVLGEFPQTPKNDIRRACIAAAKAFQTWRTIPAPVRGALFGRLAVLLRENKVALGALVTREIGKPLRESLGSVQEAIDTAEFFLSEGRRLYGQTVPSELKQKELQTFRRPLGVCGIITAGNFPVAVPSWKIIPALLCGNTVVWKPSQDAALTSQYFATLFQAAGFPAGVLNLVHGEGESGEILVSLVEEGLIQKISFTGSSAVGRKIGEICGRNLQIPSLELGGKNPMIVMEDADLELALEGALWAGYGTAGQRCTSLGNLILHEKIADRFADGYLKKVQGLKIGDPNLKKNVDYGPLMAERFLERFMQHFDFGKKDGAKLLCGKGRITASNKPRDFVGNAVEGLFVFPALWDRVDISMKIAQTEVFGPTVNLIRVKNFDEALAVANGTPYGLSSSIYTSNPVYRHRFKTEIQAGLSSINNSTTGAEAHLPFGGTKASGNTTRESGIWVLDSYTYWQAVNIDNSGGLQLAQIGTPVLEPNPQALENIKHFQKMGLS